jgi:hypothetical protein
MKHIEIYVLYKYSATRTTSFVNRLQKLIRVLALDAMTKNTSNCEQKT